VTPADWEGIIVAVAVKVAFNKNAMAAPMRSETKLIVAGDSLL
jgi:hypothetical protein